MANPGDTVTFTFKQKNHTVTASTFEQPCTPLPGGFDSNLYVTFFPLCILTSLTPFVSVFVPDNNTSGPFPQAQFAVTDTNPVWIYCRQTGHCQKGMVFAINPPSNAEFQQFKAAAMSTGAASSIAPSSASPVVSSTAAPATSTGSSSTSQDHKIIVGGTGTLAFQPSNITAQPGDTITFEFHLKNHTATQSSFNAPCVPLAETSSQVGFDSKLYVILVLSFSHASRLLTHTYH
jgi:plastocyanin